MGGGSQTQNSVSEFKPPDYTRGTWQDFLTEAQNLTQQPYEQYGGMTVAPWNGTQDAAAGLTAETAMNGSPDMNAARASNMATSQGGYLGNPYATDQYVNHAIDQNAQAMTANYQHVIQPGNDAAMARAGAFGGSGWQQQQDSQQQGLMKQIGDMANGYRMQNAQQGMGDYRAATGQMLGANSQATGFNAADNANAAALMGVGNSQNQYIQALLNQGQQAWQGAQNYPASQLGILQQALSAASGSGGTTIGSTSQSGGQPSWVTGGAGGLAALYGLLGNSGH